MADRFIVAACVIASLSLAGCTARDGGEVATASDEMPAVSTDPTPKPLAPVKATEVRSIAALEKLRGNQGLTLQWIDWNKRGNVEVSQRGDVVHISGTQVASDGKGWVKVNGDILSIDDTHFILRGTIEIIDTPDAGRRCLKTSDSEFAITQNRKYWRMREFEWCDYLTDYIDIYF